MKAIDKRLIKGIGILTVVFIFIYVSVKLTLSNAHSEPVENPSTAQMITEQSLSVVEVLYKEYLPLIYLFFVAILLLKWFIKRLMQYYAQPE